VAASRRRISIVAPAAPAKFFSSGCGLLDCVLGGGWALRRMINVVGDKSTGKTLLAIEACANFTRTFPKGRVIYDEVESAFDVDYAQTLGFPVSNLDLVDDLRTVEAFWLQTDETIKEQMDLDEEERRERPVLTVIDSMDAFSDAAEMERDVGDKSFGMAKQKIMSEGFRKKVGEMAAANITLFIISQVRDNIGAQAFSKQVRRAGGKWLDFYASQCLWLYEQEKIEKTVSNIKRKIGMRIKCRLEKSKVGWPWRECVVPAIYGYGMDDKRAALDWYNTASPKSISGIFAAAGMGDVDEKNFVRYMDKLPRDVLARALVADWERIDPIPPRGTQVRVGI